MEIVRFPETFWTQIKKAAHGSTTAENKFFKYYYQPVRAFILKLGVNPEVADDLSQEVFVRVFQNKLLTVADEKKGRFRSFILAVTKSVVANWNQKQNAQKRGGGDHVKLVSDIPADEDFDISQHLAVDEKNDSFDRLWVENLVAKAMERLKSECDEKKIPYYQALKEFLDDRDSSYESIAARMGVNAGQVRNYIHRGRKKMADFIKEEIASYCSTAEEFQDEVRYLTAFLESDE